MGTAEKKMEQVRESQRIFKKHFDKTDQDMKEIGEINLERRT